MKDKSGDIIHIRAYDYETCMWAYAPLNVVAGPAAERWMSLCGWSGSKFRFIDLQTKRLKSTCPECVQVRGAYTPLKLADVAPDHPYLLIPNGSLVDYKKKKSKAPVDVRPYTVGGVR